MMPTSTVLLILACILAPSSLSADHKSASSAPPALFAFDNGTGRGEVPLQEQAAMLAELGYDGIGYTGTQRIPEMLAALDKRGLKMFSTYVDATVGSKGASYDPGLKTAIEQLKGRETIIWLNIRGRSDDDAQAVRLVCEIADMAARSKLRVVLYPHTGFYVATVQDALRVCKKAARKNVGVAFNLCHFLKLDKPANLESTLKAAMPHLLLVSINGADSDGKDWTTLIQTLDRGTFDNGALLDTLDRLGYRGPIGLQCYQIKGDRRENLRRSISAWRRLHEPSSTARGRAK